MHSMRHDLPAELHLVLCKEVCYIPPKRSAQDSDAVGINDIKSCALVKELTLIAARLLLWFGLHRK
jgi:hypothetical protein